MTTRVFCFSDSGNALAIARGAGGGEIAPMANQLGGYAGDEERIGLVTPVYAWGPREWSSTSHAS